MTKLAILISVYAALSYCVFFVLAFYRIFETKDNLQKRFGKFVYSFIEDIFNQVKGYIAKAISDPVFIVYLMLILVIAVPVGTFPILLLILLQKLCKWIKSLFSHREYDDFYTIGNRLLQLIKVYFKDGFVTRGGSSVISPDMDKFKLFTSLDFGHLGDLFTVTYEDTIIWSMREGLMVLTKEAYLKQA
jgi:hypothetical protein